MKTRELVELLRSHPSDKLQFVLPGGQCVPSHFHVTEVARVDKVFIDCGGTQRQSVSCQLQLWYANDLDHKLHAETLASIMDLAQPILKSDELSVEIEYGQQISSLYTVTNAIVAFGTIQFLLSGKQTDCLAKEKCGTSDGSTDSVCC